MTRRKRWKNSRNISLNNPNLRQALQVEDSLALQEVVSQVLREVVSQAHPHPVVVSQVLQEVVNQVLRVVVSQALQVEDNLVHQEVVSQVLRAVVSQVHRAVVVSQVLRVVVVSQVHQVEVPQAHLEEVEEVSLAPQEVALHRQVLLEVAPLQAHQAEVRLLPQAVAQATKLLSSKEKTSNSACTMTRKEFPLSATV